MPGLRTRGQTGSSEEACCGPHAATGPAGGTGGRKREARAAGQGCWHFGPYVEADPPTRVRAARPPKLPPRLLRMRCECSHLFPPRECPSSAGSVPRLAYGVVSRGPEADGGPDCLPRKGQTRGQQLWDWRRGQGAAPGRAFPRRLRRQEPRPRFPGARLPGRFPPPRCRRV